MKLFTSLKTSILIPILSLLSVTLSPIFSHLVFEDAQYSTIFFDTNGGSSIPSMTIKVGDSFVIPETTKEGFVFVNWYSDVTLNKVINLNVMPALDIKIYAKWDAELYKIDFDTLGGNAIESINGYFGDNILLPNPPVKEGYSFNGWFRDPFYTHPFDLSTYPSMNMTLYSKWIVNAYTITFETNGGNAIQPQTKNYDTILSIPTPTKVGYSFSGWFIDVGLTQTFSLRNMPAQNLTLYAKWTINQYTVIFETNGGTAVASIIENYGDPITVPNNPIKDGYTFNGWFADANLTQSTTVPSTMPSHNLTLYANWTINQYTITFETNGGNFIPPQTINFDTFLNIPNPIKVGYSFSGWFKNLELTENFHIQRMPATNLTLYAKWQINTYTITWTNFDGTILEIDHEVPFGTIAVYNGSPPIQVNDQQYTFGNFIGWLPEITLVTNNQTYIANYEMAVNTYIISWENYDGNNIFNDYFLYGELPTFSQLIPTKPSDAQFTYTFSGWSPTISQVVDNTTYTATFTSTLRKYTVTWKNYDGTILERDYNVSYGTTPTYNGSTPTRPSTYHSIPWSYWKSYTFSGWSPSISPVYGDQEYVPIFV